MRTPVGIAIVALLATPSLFVSSAGAQQRPRAADVVVASSRAPVAITDDKLEAAADATNDIKDIHRDYDERLANAPAAERDRLVDKADSEITGAITDAGLSVREYDAILRLAKRDPAVRAKLIERMK